MNAHSITKPADLTPTTGGWYEMTAADVDRLLDEGRYEAAYLIGKGTKTFARMQFLGRWLDPVQLNVPLCGGCDSALDLGVCHACDTIYLDAPTPLRPVPMFNPDDDRFHAVPIATGVAR